MHGHVIGGAALQPSSEVASNGHLEKLQERVKSQLIHYENVIYVTCKKAKEDLAKKY